MPPVACACSPAWMGCECRCHWTLRAENVEHVDSGGILRYEYRTPVTRITSSLLPDRQWLPPGDRESWKRGIWA